ncbi:uncharacterized protein LOC130665893 [Microplitis mediator]|uniref:uncharacterized protein LOC130665893 n=1 Tax=Microplitis mediator TaxID=375433 RepID=UPI002554EC86|nr:uncharacterized protein LOC130665893 [Microplitis mediator]
MLGDERLETSSSHFRALREAETIIEEAKAGRLSPQAISPKQLYKATRDIMEKHPNFNPPQPIDRMEISTLSSVSSVKVARAKRYSLIIVTLPLFHKTLLLSYKLRPLPKPENLNGKVPTLAILPSEKFLITDPDVQQYYLADADYITKCKDIGDDLSCRPDIPLQSTENPEEVDCEMRLLMKSTEEVMRTCNVRIILKCKTTGTQLHQPNAWAYSTCAEEKLSFKCSNRIEKDCDINGTGMIQVENGCEVRNGKYLLESVDEETTQLNVTLPTLNLTLVSLSSNLSAQPNVGRYSFAEKLEIGK